MADLFGSLNLPALFTSALGETVTFTPPRGAPAAPINAIVQWDSLVVNSFEASTNASRVVAYVRGADVGSDPEGGTIKTAANAWMPAALWKIVQPISPDGEGMTLLSLERVPGPV